METDGLVQVIRQGYLQLDQPVRLASGDWSRHFIDVKRAVARGRDAALVCRALLDLAAREGLTFDAVGGLTMGADVLAHGVAVLGGVEWFSVRKAAKDRGTNKRIEGAELGAGHRVLLVDDVVTRGSSSLDALAAIRETGATVVAAMSVVDRGEFGHQAFGREAVPYFSLLTYRDLGIPAVGTEPAAPAATG